MPFFTIPIKRGQSRGLKKSWFSFGAPKQDAAGQITNEKEVGKFKNSRWEILLGLLFLTSYFMTILVSKIEKLGFIDLLHFGNNERCTWKLNVFCSLKNAAH